jgi:hypothetical protein
VKKIKHALALDPVPLTEDFRTTLSWEGAIERMYKASGITTGEAKRRKESGLDKEDLKAAQFHVDTARKSRFVRTLFGGKYLSPKKKQSM